MIERSDLINHNERGRNDKDIPHVVVPLLGQFKGETGDRSHLLLLVNETNSGIKIRKWVDRVAVMLAREGHTGAGPAMCERNGDPLASNDVDDFFKSQVERVQVEHPELIEDSVDVQEDFGIFRSL